MRSRLDAEGTDHYRDQQDIIPAINSSVQWLVNVMTRVLSEKKMSAEILRELTLIKIWQTNGFSRFAFDESQVGHGLWTVLSMHPKPTVWQGAFNAQVDFATFSAQFQAYVNGNQNTESFNGPILDRKPSSGAFLEKHDSIFRPELSYVKSEFDCMRLTHEEWVRNAKNPFKPGNTIQSADCDDVNYAYLDPTDYNSASGGYNTTPKHEFEVRPYIPYQLVAMVYVKVPSTITALTGSLEFPQTFFEMLVTKALQFVSYKQGDKTNLYSVTQQDTAALLSSIA